MPFAGTVSAISPIRLLRYAIKPDAGFEIICFSLLKCSSQLRD